MPFQKTKGMTKPTVTSHHGDWPVADAASTRPPTIGPSAEPADAPRSQRLLGAYASTLALTLTNPASIILFAAIFAGLGMARGAGSYTLALLLVTFAIILLVNRLPILGKGTGARPTS